MRTSVHALDLFRLSLIAFIVLSLALTGIAIAVGVPYRLGGRGETENVASDAFARGTGISAPLVFLIVFAILLALTWLPGRWRAVPLLLAALAGGVGVVAGVAEIPLGSGPFAYDIGPLGILLWITSLLAAIGIVIFGISAAASSLGRGSGEYRGGMIFRRLFGSRRDEDAQPGSEEVAQFDTADEGDRLIIDQLRSLGADLSKPREVLHYLYVPTEAAAADAGQEARSQGYTTEVKPAAGPPGPNPWLVLATKDEVISVASARASREAFTAMAATHGGEYDGWEAAATP